MSDQSRVTFCANLALIYIHMTAYYCHHYVLVYICKVLHISPSFLVPQFTVTISPSTVIIPNAAPYNMYNITCNATSPNAVMLSAMVVWYDNSTEAMFFNNASVSITTEPLAESRGFTSTLSVTESRSGVFFPRCEVRLFSEVSNLTTAFSPPVRVTVTGILNAWTTMATLFANNTYIMHQPHLLLGNLL